MATTREHEQALQADPKDEAAFLALRTAYREGKRFDRLVTLYEVRGQALAGAAAAELFYWAAEVRLAELNDTAGAEADLAHAVARDPGHVKAMRQLKDIYRAQGRAAECLTLLEVETAAVAKLKDQARTASLLAEMNEFYDQHLARLEQALGQPGRGKTVTAQELKQVETARKIYRALGELTRVRRLYEIELGATTDVKRRADLLLALGRLLGERVGDLEAAAEYLGEAVRLRPRDEKAAEALAAVLSQPGWSGADGRDRAADLYHQMARRRQEAGDVEGAIAAVRRALQASPGHPDASDLLERVLYGAGRLQDLDRYYRERVAAAVTDDERMDFLFKRAQLAEGDLGDQAEALRTYEQIVAIEPPGGPAAQHLAGLYAARQDWAKLAELRERQLRTSTDATHRLQLLRELAGLYRDRLGDTEQAAVCLHGILQIEPTNVEALRAYADHFRKRGDFPALLDLLEFSFEQFQAAGAAPDALVQRLEEIAVVAETRAGDVERALQAWQRMEALAPELDRAREAQRRLLQRTKQWDRMAALLRREVAGAAAPAQAVDVLRRLARLYVEKLNDAASAVGVYREILAIEPRDPVALRALQETFEQAGAWGDLALLHRSQIERAEDRGERLSLLRRLLSLYDDKLDDRPAALWAAAQILALVPGDRDTLLRLQGLHERADDKPNLAQVIEERAQHAAGSEERIALLRRAAELVQQHLGDATRAIALWQEVLRQAPEDAGALAALAELFAQTARHEDLARVLEQQLDALGDAGAQAELLRRLAGLYAGPLGDGARARAAWEGLLRLVPQDVEALVAVSAIYRDARDWARLCEVLERRVPLDGDPAAAVALALERAHLLEREMGRPQSARDALIQIVEDLDPRNLEAYGRLRRVAEGLGDHDRVVWVLEREIFLVSDSATRAAKAIELGDLLRDRLRDPKRAVGAFERAVEIDPNQTVALRALRSLYREVGEFERLVMLNERLLTLPQPAADDRRRLMTDITDLYEEKLGKPRMAFEWARRVYHETPDEEALRRLESLAERHGLWEDLIQVYGGEQARSLDPAVRLEVALKVARLCEERLGSAARAFAILRDALPYEPSGERLLPEIERLALDIGDHAGLLDVYTRVARGRPQVESRVELLRARARVREERMNDVAGAMDEQLRAFALSPADGQTQDEVLRLAAATSRWEDALGMLARLFALAGDQLAKVEVATRAAALVEEKLRDQVRAFHAYLNAFRLAPEDEVIAGHLWRLAEAIGKYHAPAPPPAPPTEEPAELEVEPEPESEQTLEAVAGADGGAAAGAATEAATDAEVEELGVDDLEAATPPPVTIPPPGPGAAPPPLRPRAPPPAFATPWEEWAQTCEALPAADSGSRRRYLLRVAAIWERGAGDVARALGALERAFFLDPSDPDARAELRRMAEQVGRWSEVADIYLRAAERVGREDAMELQREVARLRVQHGDRAGAEDRYRAILVLQGDDDEALESLEHSYREQERWAALAEILEKRIGGRGSLSASARRSKRFELAELYEQRLDRPYEALDTLEKYVEGLDDDEHGDDDRAQRESVDAFAALARLYERVGAWPKALRALEGLIARSRDADAVRQTRLRAARIWEKELSSPDRAVETYEAVLASHPTDAEALAALDRLYEALGRHEALVDLLGRRIEVAEAAERAELIRRQAKILDERLGNADAAAAALRALGSEALLDDEASAAMLRNLRKAGLAHEALRLIEQRREALEKSGVRGVRLVALDLEAAALMADSLGDDQRALHEVERALARDEENADALALLARLCLKRNDFRGYASALRRQAGGSVDRAHAARLLVEAGAAFRDQCDDKDTARACFEQAVLADGAQADALRALAALLAEAGDTAAARQVLERHVAAVADPQARAAVLTDLGRLSWEKPGDAPEALRHLQAALELAPQYLPAVVATADVCFDEQRWSDAEKHLLQAVRRVKGSADEIARVFLRLAEVYDKLGRREEAYRQLQEANRLAPGHLGVRIALGENRFAAGKWREAATHFEGLADHPGAAAAPDATADALAHGAQAEIKLRRPERALALYEAALRLRAGHAPSLRALADLALEHGDAARAIDHLRALGEAASDREEKTRIWEQIGDLEKAREDAEAARAAYEKAVAAASKPDEHHLPLYEKVFEAQRLAGAHKAAAKTARKMMALASDPKVRARLQAQAAALLREQGEHDDAVDVLRKALDDSPQSEDILQALVEAADAAGRAVAEIEEELALSLPQLPAPAGKTAIARRAALWRRLGEARRARGEVAGAIEALEKAVELAGDTPEARAALADLHQRAGHGEDAFASQKRVVNLDPTREDAVRTLARLYAERFEPEAARACLEVLALLGLANDEDAAFLRAHAVPALPSEDPYIAALDERARAGGMAAEEARAMADVFAAIWEGMPGLGGVSLADAGASAEDKVSPVGSGPVARVLRQVARAFGNQKIALYVGRKASAPDVTIVVGPPPAVVLGTRLATADEATLRFHVARALEMARPEYILAAALPAKAFAQLFSAVLKAFHPRHGRWRAGSHEETAEQAVKLKKALPYKTSKWLAETFQKHEATPWSSARWRQVVQETGNRAGLLACADLGLAARLVLRESGKDVPDDPGAIAPELLRAHAAKAGPLADLLRFALSDDYFALRRSLVADPGADGRGAASTRGTGAAPPR